MQRSLSLISKLFFLSLMAASPIFGNIEFSEPQVLFSSTQEITFARNTSDTLASDSQGNLHLIFSVGEEKLSPPSYQVMYQQINRTQFTQAERIDHASQGGGNHPSLAIDANDTVHAVWQDNRHATAQGSYIDNLEIYYNRKINNETFLAEDIRITQTSANHMGDNGFTPAITVSPDQRLHIAWHDFHIDGNHSDIYYFSNETRTLPETLSDIEPYRITFFEQDSSSYSSRWFPDMAPLPDGSVLCLWGFLEGWQGEMEIRSRLILTNGEKDAVSTLVHQGGTFLDPPRLVSHPSGNLALTYTRQDNGQNNVYLRSFDLFDNESQELQLNHSDFSGSQPCPAFASTERTYVVWQEDLGGISQIWLAEIDIEQNTLLQRQPLTSENIDAHHASIAWDSHHQILHLVWIENDLDGNQKIIHRHQLKENIPSWMTY